jgi:cation transport protein ChaC
MDREWLSAGGIEQMMARIAPQVRILSEEERKASLRATLASRPEPEGDIWLFGYGSLIWNPTVRFEEQRVVCVPGWHRCFCLTALAGRGTPQNPGLLLGLDRGGRCIGVAYRLAEAVAEKELSLLWQREMVAGSYVPLWLPAYTREGKRLGHVIAFTINHSAPAYAANLDEAEIVRRLATARGELGSAAEYLFRTLDALRSLGVHDELMEKLAVRVEEELNPLRHEQGC